MKSLAKLVSTILLAAGSIAAFFLIISGFNAFNDFGGGGWLLIGSGIGAFCSAAATACVLSLLASIDERLRDAGWLSQDERDEANAAQRRADVAKGLTEEIVQRPGIRAGLLTPEIAPEDESIKNFEKSRGA